MIKVNTHRFQSHIWRIHLTYLFNSIPNEMSMTAKTVKTNNNNRDINQPYKPLKASNATTDQRVIRPGGVDAKEGGAAGGTCSSPGGRSGVSVGLRRENSTAKAYDSAPQANWNNLLRFATQGNPQIEVACTDPARR